MHMKKQRKTKMGMFQIKHRTKMVNKFKLLLLSNAKKATPPSKPRGNCEIRAPHESMMMTCEPQGGDQEGIMIIKEHVRWSERLVFEPAGTTSSILEAAKVPFRDSVVVALSTKDPRLEFRVSMEEMVEAIGIEGSEELAELLAWYLRMNRKENHCHIVEAFIEMFTGSTFLACPVCARNSSTSNSTSTASSSTSGVGKKAD